MIIKFSFIYLFFINLELFNNRNLKAKEINLNLNSCHWIPITIKKNHKKKFVIVFQIIKKTCTKLDSILRIKRLFQKNLLGN